MRRGLVKVAVKAHLLSVVWSVKKAVLAVQEWKDLVLVYKHKESEQQVMTSIQIMMVKTILRILMMKKQSLLNLKVQEMTMTFHTAN